MIRLFWTNVALLIALAVAAGAAVHTPRSIDSLPVVYGADSSAIDLLAASDTTTVVAVRHLGAICSHCVEQIILLNEYANEFRRRNARVIAFSMDDVDECQLAAKEHAIDTDVLQLCYDERDACSRAVGSTIQEIDGSFTDLHAVLVIRQRMVVFEHYSTQPLMSLGGVFEVLGE